MRIKYNAPTTLSYAFFCTLVVALDQSIMHGLTRAFFTVPPALSFNLMNPLNYLRLFTHIAGHADWNHLISNLAYVLLLGPMLEEAYGSFTMFLMIIVTGFVTGVLNACFFPNPLLGASGVVFMMILLASFTNHGKDDVPLTFILIVILYLGREILNAFKVDDISQFAHLAGGLCGSLFGFFSPSPGRTRLGKITAEKITVARKPVTGKSPTLATRTAISSRSPGATRSSSVPRQTGAARATATTLPASDSRKNPSRPADSSRNPGAARTPGQNRTSGEQRSSGASRSSKNSRPDGRSDTSGSRKR